MSRTAFAPAHGTAVRPPILPVARKAAHLTIAALFGVVPNALMAQNLSVYGGVGFEYLVEPDGPGSSDDNTISAYIEVERGGFYGGVWAGRAKDSLSNEIDLYLGNRGDLTSFLTYDVAYTRYFYPNDGGDCCGEFYFGLGATLSDLTSASFSANYDPDADIGSSYVGLSQGLGDHLSLSANFGVCQLRCLSG